MVVGFKKESVFLVFEYCQTDIANLVDYMIKKKEYLSLSEIKALML